jgi:tRNA pseudouridine55 synthase
MNAGIHLIHKPPGPTSFAAMKAYLGGEKIKACHGGTLDPFAQGMLLILIGPATRLFEYLHDVPKVYEAIVRWGIETDNGDPLGKPVFTADPSNITRSQIEETLATFVGWQEQIPPATSAKRIGGERAYEKAHRGETVDLPPSRVYLHEAIWLEHDLPRQSRLRIVVRGGFYVRSLVRDMGRALGCGAHLSALHRTAIGPWTDPAEGRAVELHDREILPWLPVRELSDDEVGRLRQGQRIPRGEILPADWMIPKGFPQPLLLVRAFHQGRFLFLLREMDNSTLAIERELGRGL